MTKIELITALTQKGNCTRKEADEALTLVTDVIIESLIAGEKVHLTGLGTFEIHERKAKETKNPRSGKKMTVPAKNAPAFRASKSLKEAVNKK
mgnify:CR=1 FL=1